MPIYHHHLVSLFRSLSRHVLLRGMHIFPLLFLLLPSTITHAQVKESILKYDKQVIFIGISRNVFEMQFKPNEMSNFVSLRPNILAQFSIGYTFNGIKSKYKILNLLNGMSVSIPIPINKQNVEVFGRTKTPFLNIDLSGSVMKNTFFYSLTSSHIKGFYVNNIFELDSTYLQAHDNQNFLRPDLKVKKIGGQVVYIFNKKMSYNAIFTYQERQLRSAASLLVNAGYYHTTITADSNLYSRLFIQDSIPHSNLRTGRYDKPFIGLGGGGTLVFWKKFFLHGSMLLGVQYNLAHTSYQSPYMEIQKQNNSWTTTANLKIGIGYNTDKWFMGISSNFDYDYDDSRTTTLIYRKGNIKTTIGRRF